MKRSIAKPGHRTHTFFARDEDGATAVEFAMIAAPFFAMLFGIMVSAQVFWVAHSMDVAAQSVGRLIRTGQAQGSGMTMAQFKTAVCSEMAMGQSDCEKSLVIDVNNGPSVGDLNTSPPQTGDELDPSKGSFSPGGSSSYVIVKLYMNVTAMNGILELVRKAGAPERKMRIGAAVVFRNEPFGA